MGGSHTPGWLPKRQLLRPRISGAAAAEQAGRLPPPEDEGGTTGLQLRRKRKVHTRTAGPGARRQCLLGSPNLRSDGESKKKRNGKKTKKKLCPAVARPFTETRAKRHKQARTGGRQDSGCCCCCEIPRAPPPLSPDAGGSSRVTRLVCLFSPPEGAEKKPFHSGRATIQESP